MKNTMEYKGYTSIITYSAEDECFVGHLAGISDIVGFHGDSVQGLRVAFNEAVDFYLESCAKSGHKPNKPYSGRITLRLPPTLHARLAVQAESNGSSLNNWLIKTLDNTAPQSRT